MTKFFETDKILDAWVRAHARLVETPPPTTEYAAALTRAYTNGRVVTFAFELELDEGVFAMATHPENWKSSRLLDLVWHVPGVREALPPLEGFADDPAFAPVDVFELGASMSRAMHNGGAYSKWDAAPAARAFESGVNGALAFAGSDPSFMAFTSHAPWCSFFLDVAWDYTVVAVRPKDRHVSVLLATDTD